MRFYLIIILLGSLLVFPVLSLAMTTPCCDHQMEAGMMDEMSPSGHGCCDEADICFLGSSDCECQMQLISYPPIYSLASYTIPMLVVVTHSHFIPSFSFSSRSYLFCWTRRHVTNCSNQGGFCHRGSMVVTSFPTCRQKPSSKTLPSQIDIPCKGQFQATL